MFWESSPYSWPVVGWPSDIPAISKAQADEFYATFYSPQNITLILIGEFKSDRLEELAKQYFERIPRGPRTPPDVATFELSEDRLSVVVFPSPVEALVTFGTHSFGSHRPSRMPHAGRDTPQRPLTRPATRQ